MKVRCLLIALALFAAFATDSWGQSKQPAPKATQQGGFPQERGTENSPVVVKVIPNEKSKEELGHETARDKEKAAVDERIASLTGDLAFYTKLLFAATAALALITLGLVISGFRQVRDAKQAIAAAVDSAAAARISAEAFMNAEGAQLFPVLHVDNLSEVFSLGSSSYTPATGELLLPPKITYYFKNYGKTPARLRSIMHSIEFSVAPSKSHELTHAEDDRPLEIIGGGEESAVIECEMLATFNKEKAKSVTEYQGELIFYGMAFFTDFFDRKFICEWKYDGRPGGFELTQHAQRLDLDKRA